MPRETTDFAGNAQKPTKENRNPVSEPRRIINLACARRKHDKPALDKTLMAFEGVVAKLEGIPRCIGNENAVKTIAEEVLENGWKGIEAGSIDTEGEELRKKAGVVHNSLGYRISVRNLEMEFLLINRLRI